MDFNKILASTISGINKGYDEAIGDLRSIVQDVASAIRNNSKCNFDVFIRPLSESPRGDVLRICFDTDSENPDAEIISIATLFLPPKGYPMQLGAYRKVTDEFKGSRTLESRESLEALFAEMLSDPESALIQAIGFGIRKLNAIQDDDLPF